MPYEITRIDVWSAELEDHAGALADKLAAVMSVGANLDFVIVRPTAEKPGRGVLFLAPLIGREQTDAAAGAGISKANIHALRIIGPDRPGLTAGIAKTLADAKINIAGLSGAGLADKSLFYIRFASAEDLGKATEVLAAKLA